MTNAGPPADVVSAARERQHDDASGWPTVSVVVPTHGRPQLVPLTVRSILEQRYPGTIEVLVVFDREEPRDLGLDVPPGRVLRLLENDRTPGPAGAYNVGALAATGEYFALCDDDDEWLPDKLRLQAEAMRRHPEAVFGACGIYLGDASDRTRNPTRIPTKPLLSVNDLLTTARNALHSSTFIARLDAVREGFGLVDEDIPDSYGEDYDWLIRAARVAPVVVVQQPLVRVRWQFSYYGDRWRSMVESLSYQLEHRPEFTKERSNLSRIYGRMAFAHAALGEKKQAKALARRSIRADWRQQRGYLTYLVAWGLVKPETVVKALHRFGRGM
jgi:cellulose synthase/poly-beta-1,6-N-acetylglucosamine synthase-like glycosyltransferase